MMGKGYYRAVIAAAGRGTRFLPATKAYPKELVPLLGKPNIQYLVEELLGAGIREIAIVHRHGDPRLKRYFTPDEELEKYLRKNKKTAFLQSLRLIWRKIKILKFIPQSPRLPYGSASALLAARSFAQKTPFIFMYGDDLVVEKKPGQFLQSLMARFEKEGADVVAAASPVPWEEIERYSSVRYLDKKTHQIKEVLEKLPRAQAPSNMTLFGRFVVSPQIFSILAHQKISPKGELFFTDTVNAMAQKGKVLAPPIKNAQWLTTGDPLRWLKANIILALNDPLLKKDMRSFLKTYRRG